MQLLSLIFLGLCGCSTPSPTHSAGKLDAVLPEGYYKFDCPIVYENGFAKLTHRKGRVHVQLLEDFTGSFFLQISGGDSLKITEAEMDYPGLKRRFSGDGRVIRPGTAEGEAVIWLTSMGPISRNHRKGEWTLRQATPQETRAFAEKQHQLEARRERALETGAELE